MKELVKKKKHLSSASGPSTRSKLYWKPEQPPALMLIRSTGFVLSSEASSRSRCVQNSESIRASEVRRGDG